MPVNEGDIEKIERFLDGDMSEEEEHAFSSRLAYDTALSEELQIHQAAIASLVEKAKTKKELRSIFDEVKAAKEKEGKKGVIHWKLATVLSLLAAAIVLLPFFINFFQVEQEPDYQRLYMTYYQVLYAESSIRDGEETHPAFENLEQKAVELYKSAKYKKAAEAFENIKKRGELKDKYWLYLGNCYLNLEDWEAAKVALEKGGLSKNSFVRQAAQWYLSLLDVRLGRGKAALVRLNTIAKSKGAYHKEAQSLLDELD